LHWNIATADRNISNSLKAFAKSFSNLQTNEENSKLVRRSKEERFT
jgi:hypothetical protein